VYKRVRVLSAGERTRLAVARMLLRPSNTLLLDEPTNHLDLDSKEVLLDARVDYGGTLVFVSHDRYFVERLATKIVEVGNGEAVVYPGTYREFLWHKEHPQGQAGQVRQAGRGGQVRNQKGAPAAMSARNAVSSVAGNKSGSGGGTPRESTKSRDPRRGHEEKKRADAHARKLARAEQARRARIDDLETRIAEREHAIREIEAAMAAPGFYDDRAAAQPV